MARYGPPDASRSPRFTGVRTFARCPLITDPDGVDVAAIGLPFDTATSNRPGARFGPAAIRDASRQLRPYNPAQEVNVFELLSVVDAGDVETTPGNAERTVEQIADAIEPWARSGCATLGLGGDHSVVLGELRALASVHGPLGLVLLDAHTDTWDAYFGERYFHGTPFRRAVEEGLLAPERSLMAGIRGSLYSRGDLDDARELGFELIDCEELLTMPAVEFGERARARVADGPAFASFDVDFVDPAYAPGTGTPEPGGASAREALALVRALRGIDLKGADVVEVSPPYDSRSQTTAGLASAIAYEFVSLMAVRRRDG
jgi:agmatinase